jgi:hypothetical protein
MPNKSEADSKCIGWINAGIPKWPNVAPDITDQQIIANITIAILTSECERPKVLVNKYVSHKLEKSKTAEKLR